MKKRIIAFVCVVFLFLVLCSCSKKTPPENVLLNYADNTSLLAVGDVFVTVSPGYNEIFIFPSDHTKPPYVYTEDAVFVCEHEHHGGYFLVGADDVSFYYLRRSYSGNGYGEGHGARVFRYYIETGKTELVYMDVALTNFDGFLGLEDILGFSGPISNDAVTEMGGFWIKGKDILTSADLLDMLKASNEAHDAGVKLSDFGFKYCVAGESVFFTDSFQNLYLYRMNTEAFTALPFYSVSMFFVTENNLFVIPSTGADLTVCDLNGNMVKTISSDGAVFDNAHCCRTENGALYLQDQYGIIWKIGENLEVAELFYVEPDTRWTVRNGSVYYYDMKQNAVLPAVH